MRFVATLCVGLLAAASVRAQANKYDGDYGTPYGTMGSGSACSTTRFAFGLKVRNGQASMQTVTQGTLEGAVHPDGSIDIAQGRATLQGKVDGSKFAGVLSIDSNCQFQLSYPRL